MSDLGHAIAAPRGLAGRAPRPSSTRARPERGLDGAALRDSRVRKPLSAPRIVLVGLPATGKSTLGKALAASLGLPHVDLDQAIEADAGLAVADLLRSEGEAVFRIREARVLRDVLAGPPAVVSTGGGAPAFHDGIEVMRQSATVLWLDAPPETLVQRTLADETDRPLLGATRQDQLTALQQLAQVRTPAYAKAHRRIDASQTRDQVLRQALRALAPADELVACAEDGTLHPVILHDGHACDAAERLATLLQGRKAALLVDKKVRHEAGPLQAALQARGVAVTLLEVPGGEASKDVRQATRLWSALAEAGLGRTDALVTLGGGATTDLGGFVAATFLRGIAVLHLPTTVLAMADASIGGKTAIDLDAGKNLVGAFHTPQLCWLPLGALDSLPGREWRAGLAEIAKIFAILDADAWKALIADAPALRRRDAQALRPHLRRAVELKAQVVAADPREKCEPGPGLQRALLNFGHTLGHAIEAESRYAVRHGEAVALGMVAAAEVSEALCLTDAGVATAVRDGLTSLDLPVAWEAHVSEDTLARLARDKKVRSDKVPGDTMAFVALTALGQARVEPVRLETLVSLLRALRSTGAGPTRRR